MENRGGETNQAKRDSHPANALAESRGPKHGGTEKNETHWHNKEPYVKYCIEYALGGLPHESKGRLFGGGHSRSLIEVRKGGVGDMRGR